MMKKEQTAEMTKLIKKMKRIFSRVSNAYGVGKFDRVLKYIEQGEELIKRFQEDVPEEIKSLHTEWLWLRAIISAYKGNLALSFKYANELITVGQLYDHKRGISLGTHELGRY